MSIGHNVIPAKVSHAKTYTHAEVEETVKELHGFLHINVALGGHLQIVFFICLKS